MTAFDLAGVQAWSKAHGYALNDRRLPALRDVEHCDVFDILPDAGRRVALVRRHLSIFEEEDEVCVWLWEWNVWPSSQWHHIFERFRMSYGVHEPLSTMPGHLIPKGEVEAAVSSAVYSVLMLWDCHVLGASGRPFLFYSHDEYGKKLANQALQATAAPPSS